MNYSEGEPLKQIMSLWLWKFILQCCLDRHDLNYEGFIFNALVFSPAKYTIHTSAHCISIKTMLYFSHMQFTY